MHDDLASRLRARLQHPLPGRAMQTRFEPELAYGRHFDLDATGAIPAAVVALLYSCDGQWHLPLIVRPADTLHHAGQIALPGGVLESGEESNAGGLRELSEELGFDATSVRILGPLSPIYVFVTAYRVTPWLAWMDQRPDIRPNPHEVAELLEIPLLDLARHDCHDRHLREVGDLTFYAPHIEWQGHRVWGATAMILGELLALLEGTAGAVAL